MRISKHNLISYSLLLVAVPISVLADSPTMPAAATGMLSPPTKASVGHRPEKKKDGYRLEMSGKIYSENLIYAPFPGMTITRDDIHTIEDPDNDYQATETFTTVCTYYQINKDGSQHSLKHERPCQYKFDIKKEHVGSKIKLEIYSETDIASALGYIPVPSVSEFSYVETKTISNTPSRDLTVMIIDKTVLSPGERATITTLVKDIDGSPVDNALIDTYSAYAGGALWDIEPVKKGINPGEYEQIITYLGSGNGRVDITYKYQGELFSKKVSVTGRL